MGVEMRVGMGSPKDAENHFNIIVTCLLAEVKLLLAILSFDFELPI